MEITPTLLHPGIDRFAWKAAPRVSRSRMKNVHSLLGTSTLPMRPRTAASTTSKFWTNRKSWTAAFVEATRLSLDGSFAMMENWQEGQSDCSARCYYDESEDDAYL